MIVAGGDVIAILRSVVTQDVPDSVNVIGYPGKVI
jgi:serine acetyltransferase